MSKNLKLTLGLISATALAAGTGFLAASALSQGSQDPTSTTTVQIGTGEVGPPGPAGPTGAPGPSGPPGPEGPTGGTDCGEGWHLGVVVFPQQGVGPTTIKTCVKN